MDGNVAYVSDEKGVWGQRLLASLQVSESQRWDHKPTTLLWVSVSSSVRWRYSWSPRDVWT